MCGFALGIRPGAAGTSRCRARRPPRTDPESRRSSGDIGPTTTVFSAAKRSSLNCDAKKLFLTRAHNNSRLPRGQPAVKCGVARSPNSDDETIRRVQGAQGKTFLKSAAVAGTTSRPLSLDAALARTVAGTLSVTPKLRLSMHFPGANATTCRPGWRLLWPARRAGPDPHRRVAWRDTSPDTIRQRCRGRRVAPRRWRHSCQPWLPG
jgi:hypothetical protein